MFYISRRILRRILIPIGIFACFLIPICRYTTFMQFLPGFIPHLGEFKENGSLKILVYGSFFEWELLEGIKHNSIEYHPNKCEITRSSTPVDFDVVILNFLPIPKFLRDYRFYNPDVKRKKIMFLLIFEPPWSVHYRIDIEWLKAYFDVYIIGIYNSSFIYQPYGEMLPKKQNSKNLDDDLENNFKQRFPKCLAIISNCNTYHTDRLSFIEKLRKIIPVDLYGSCKGKAIAGDMHINLMKSYKFFLAFENSLCEEYITEKFWKSLVYGAIPVVYGGGNYSNVAPPDSYINVKSFSSIQKVGEYLNYISNDYDEYKKYFQWHKKYEAIAYPQNPAESTSGSMLCKYSNTVIDKKIPSDITLEKITNKKLCVRRFMEN